MTCSFTNSKVALSEASAKTEAIACEDSAAGLETGKASFIGASNPRHLLGLSLSICVKVDCSIVHRYPMHLLQKCSG